MFTIMIIDDSEADQFLASHVIEEFNPEIDVLQAYDGQEALDILRVLPKQPDVIFLDINMPRMNGHDFLKEYDKWNEHSIIIIMLTSSDQTADREMSRAYESVVDYFTKPLSTQALEKASQLSTKR